MSDATPTTPTQSSYAVFGALTGLVAVLVLLQGVWAGIFLEHDGQRDDASGWIDVHAIGARIALALALVSLVWAVWRLRSRRDLVIGSVLLFVALLIESILGGLVRDSGKDALTAVHVPLAMVIMGLVVWLPLRARAGRS